MFELSAINLSGWSNRLLDWVGGAVTGFVIAVLAQSLGGWYTRWRKKTTVRRATDELRRYLTRVAAVPCVKDFELLQAVPGGAFESEDVSAILEPGVVVLADVKKIADNHKALWESQGKWNGRCFGVTNIRGPRHGQEESPELRFTVKGRPYFEYMATNLQLCIHNDLIDVERQWLIKEKGKYHDLWSPNTNFVNPLSVEVLVLCENSSKIVVGSRSAATGFRAEMLQPPGSEALNEKDINDEKTTCKLIDVCYRALDEELGLKREFVTDMKLTSLIFDLQEYDYELTALAWTGLDEKSIAENWRHAQRGLDKGENDHLEFLTFPIRSFSSADLKRWTHQAFAAYLMALYICFSFEDARNSLDRALAGGGQMSDLQLALTRISPMGSSPRRCLRRQHAGIVFAEREAKMVASTLVSSANLVSVWCLFLQGTRGHGADFGDFRDSA
jgi:hypothetical protein